MKKIKNRQCLLLKTKDKREFLTEKSNYSLLLEFSKKFSIEVSVIKIKEATILELNELAAAFCSQNYSHEKITYELIETKISQIKKPRNNVIETSEKLDEYIKKEFLAEKIISLKKIKRRFSRYELTDSCLCNHIRKIRKELETEGYKINKNKTEYNII
jgi:hypothetical protein